MLTDSELRVFRKNLPRWFREHQRELPWRLNKDPYRVWLSEIMLQQTRVAAVIPYFERFLARFPTIASLAEAPAEEVLRLWSGLGYYSRARNLQRAAQQIAALHAGKFPERETDVLALPGIGAYTSAAILSIAFDQPRAVLDGNVARVLARLFAVRGDLREPAQWRQLQENADALLDRKSPGDWNQSMMELGATVCTPRAPQCLLCPAAKYCGARKLGMQDQIPEKRRKRATATVTLAAAVFLDALGRTLLLPPPAADGDKITAEHVPTLVSKLWHFPTIAAAADPRGELRRHVRHLLSAKKTDALVLTPLARIRHAVTYRQITIFPFRIAVAKLPVLAGAKAVALEDVGAVAISNLTRKISRVALAEPA
jgi:A/G-specific adenine glycosylase